MWKLLMLTTDDGVSCLFVSALGGHVDVVKALLEVGGRELVMLTMHSGVSCLSIARLANPDGEVCRVLEVASQNACLSSHEITILTRGFTKIEVDKILKLQGWLRRAINR